MSELVLFVIVGGFAALVNVIARLIFDQFVSFEVAVILAFPVALTTAFTLNRNYVFQSRSTDVVRQYVRFALVNVAALLQVLLVSVLLARVLFPLVGFEWHMETVAHVLGVLSPVLTSYLLHKSFTFVES